MQNFDTSNYPTLEQNGFRIISFAENLSILKSQIIRAYKEVYDASAWREGVKCSSGCGFKTTFEEAPKNCQNCGGGIEDYYSDTEISDSILGIMSKTYFQGLVILKGDEVAGFTWGWKDNLKQINKDKLGFNLTKYNELIENIINNGGCNEASWYYQSETGIIPKFRGRGLGSAIVGVNEQLLQQNKDKVDAIIQRTSQRSPMYAIRKKLGYTEIFSYNDVDKRVIFIKNNS